MSGSAETKTPLVSIVTICRNAEKNIAGTVRSVLSQDYPNVEYLIIDGNSTDGTLKKAKEAIADFPGANVRIISEKDNGISDAMNKGVRLANGGIICHLHAGDSFITSDVLGRVMRSHIEAGWRWGVAGSIVVNEKGKPFHVYYPCRDKKQLIKKNCIPHQSTFLVKDIFNKHGLFSEDLKQAMDYEFWLRIAFKGGEEFTVLPFNTTYFCSGGRSSDIRELLRYLSRLRKMIKSYGIRTNFISDAIFLGRVYMFHLYSGVKEALRGR